MADRLLVLVAFSFISETKIRLGFSSLRLARFETIAAAVWKLIVPICEGVAMFLDEEVSTPSHGMPGVQADSSEESRAPSSDD